MGHTAQWYDTQMNRNQKERARALRAAGKSIREIERELNIARSNISNWVRDVVLSEDQMRELSARSRSQGAIEKRRESRLRNARALRLPHLVGGVREIMDTKSLDIMMLGLGIYMGEGTKTSRGTIALSNTDPRIIQIFVRFLQEKFHVQVKDLRGQVGVHSHLSIDDAEEYWAGVSGVPRKNFVKTAVQHGRQSKGKRDKLPFGTFTVYLHSTERRLKLEGWIQGTYQRLFPENTALHTMTKLRI